MGRMKETLGDTLFEFPLQAFARSTDLQTSHDAARKIEKVLNKIQLKCYVAVRDRGQAGATSNEVVEQTGLKYRTVSARWKPLRKLGKIAAKLDDEGKPVRRDGQTVWIVCG